MTIPVTVPPPGAVATPTVWFASPGSTLGSSVATSTIVNVPEGASLYLPIKTLLGTPTTVSLLAAIAGITVPPTGVPGPTLKALHAFGTTNISIEAPGVTFVVSNNDTLFVPVTASLPVAGVNLTSLEIELAKYLQVVPASSTPAATTSSTSSITISNIFSVGSQVSLTGSQTSSQTTSTTPVSTEQTPAGGSISTGGAAGGIVGALIGGLVLGGLIAWLCIRRKRKPTRHLKRSMEQELKPVPFVGHGSSRSRLSLAPSALMGWRKHIPQEQSEKNLTNSLTSVNHYIEMYVAAFYDSRQANVTAGQLASLSTIADAETMSYAKAAQRSEPILERVIAAFLISRVSFKSDNNDSLLPADLSTIPKRLGLNLESRDIGPRAYTERSGFLAAVAEWRVLTAFLTTDVDPKAQQKLDTKVENTVKLLIAGLSSFEDRQHDSSSRERELHKIVVNMAEAGQALFRQPSTFVFDWTDHSHSIEPSIITFPALVKTMEENGHRLDKPKTVLPAKLKRI